jgi:hypothetical protein
MENKIITPEELTKLKEINDKRGELVEQFGMIEINIQDLDLQKQILIKSLSELKNDEAQFGALLQQKYGDVSINLNTGEITPR